MLREKEPLLYRHLGEQENVAKHSTQARSGRRFLCYLLIALSSGVLFLPYILMNYLQPQYSTYPNSSLKWESCGEINEHKLECTRIDVPMNQFNKSSSDKTFSIPLIRMLATNTSANGGKSILLNPGGPGGSGAEFIWRRGDQLNKIIGEGFHLLSFDPRGVNGSIPRASCFSNPQQRAHDYTSVPWDATYEAGEMFTRAENLVKACADTMGEHGAYINTPQTAADMNSILDAIGQKEMYYWGFSYGTTLGQTYAQIFPERVSRLVIDGVSNLDDWYNSFSDDEDLIDTDNVYAGFVEECFLAKENCPLNSVRDTPFESAAELKIYIDSFVKNLEEEPIPVYLSPTDYGAITGRGIKTNAIFPALYKPTPVWSILAKNLAELLTGNATAAYKAYSDSWLFEILSDETNTFVIHNDNWKTGKVAPVHGIKAIQNFSLSRPDVSELITKYQGSDTFVRASWEIPTSHNFHPHYYPEYPKFKTAEKILFLSTTYDPVCPLISAKKAQASFEGSVLVEQKSYGHCSVSMPSLCTAKHVRRYFYEGLLPEEGATCGIDSEYFPSLESPMGALTDLSVEDTELLKALHELAALGIEDGNVFRRGIM